MGFFSQLAQLIESLFFGNTSENQPKQEMHRIEQNLRSIQPPMYKNKQFLPTMGELFKTLYEHTQPIDAFFSESFASNNLKKREYFVDLLIQTGFSPKDKEILNNLTYEKRKEEFAFENNIQRIIDKQKHDLNTLLKDLNGDIFRQIEKTLLQLELFGDICKFGFLPAIRLFDSTYNPDNMDQDYHFTSVPVLSLDNVLMDLYYLTANLTITASMARAICTVEQVQSDYSLSEEKQKITLTHIRKIASVFAHYFTPTILEDCLKLIKNDIDFKPKTAVLQPKFISIYSEHLHKQFETDTQRITVEIQDERIKNEISNLFGSKPLLPLNGYSAENNLLFMDAGAGSFLYITPLQIIKSFFTFFYDDRITSLLNDLVVEGFFNNAQYKTDFASIVFACSETQKHITEFENLFQRNNQFDIVILNGYLRDGHTNPEFITKLSGMIDELNKKAKSIVQMEITAFFQLYKRIEELLPDAKKTTPEHISNLKILFISPRNKDKIDFLETSFGQWNIFLEIMKNYAIIGEVRDN